MASIRVRQPPLAQPSSPTIVWINVSGVWKQAIVWTKVAGTWKQTTPFIKVSGIWK